MSDANNHMQRSSLRSSRGSQTNPHNRFFTHEYEVLDEYRELCRIEDEPVDSDRTRYLEVHPKTEGRMDRWTDRLMDLWTIWKHGKPGNLLAHLRPRLS